MSILGFTEMFCDVAFISFNRNFNLWFLYVIGVQLSHFFSLYTSKSTAFLECHICIKLYLNPGTCFTLFCTLTVCVVAVFICCILWGLHSFLTFTWWSRNTLCILGWQHPLIILYLSSSTVTLLQEVHKNKSPLYNFTGRNVNAAKAQCKAIGFMAGLIGIFAHFYTYITKLSMEYLPNKKETNKIISLIGFT